MLFDSGFVPIITKATRITDHSKTSIDHIYTNIPQMVLKSGICLAGISDHLLVFCSSAHKFPITNESRCNRDLSNFNKDFFLKEISEIDFASLIGEEVNESMNASSKLLINMLQFESFQINCGHNSGSAILKSV